MINLASMVPALNFAIGTETDTHHAVCVSVWVDHRLIGGVAEFDAGW